MKTYKSNHTIDHFDSGWAGDGNCLFLSPLTISEIGVCQIGDNFIIEIDKITGNYVRIWKNGILVKDDTELIFSEKNNGIIKFNKAYKKLYVDGLPIQRAYLIHVQKLISGRFIHPSLVEYDTDGEYSNLPDMKKPVLLLIFKAKGCHLFTTIRKYTEDKHNYYLCREGKIFDISVV